MICLCIANFLSSFGGGAVLGKGLTFLADEAGFRADSVFAYLLGTSFSLIFILKFRRSIHQAGYWLTAMGSIVAILLYQSAFYVASADPGWFGNPYLFFAMLCGFFSLVFVPRTFRSDFAAKLGRVSWTELAYSGGYVVSLGLARWIPEQTLLDALVWAAIAGALASLFDFSVSRMIRADAESAAPEPEVPVPAKRALRPIEYSMLATLALSTVAVQVVIQRLMSVTNDTLPFLAFEIGVTIAPLLATAGALAIEDPRTGLLVASVRGRRGMGFRFVRGITLSFAATALGVYLMPVLGSGSAFLFALFLFGSLLYELAAILLFDALPIVSDAKAPVAMAFGALGAAVTVAYALFLYFDIGAFGCGLVIVASYFCLFGQYVAVHFRLKAAG